MCIDGAPVIMLRSRYRRVLRSSSRETQHAPLKEDRLQHSSRRDNTRLYDKNARHAESYCALGMEGEVIREAEVTKPPHE